MKSKPHAEQVRADLVIPKPFMSNPLLRHTKRVGTHYTINQEVKEWLKEMITSHWYLFEHREHGGLWIAFHNHNDAMKFKLTWR